EQDIRVSDGDSAIPDQKCSFGVLNRQFFKMSGGLGGMGGMGGRRRMYTDDDDDDDDMSGATFSFGGMPGGMPGNASRANGRQSHPGARRPTSTPGPSAPPSEIVRP